MSPQAHDHTTAPAEVLDPVCGMTIDPADSVGEVDYKGQKYFFCSQSCLERFRANPAEFLAPRRASGSTTAPPKADAEYICPMDPEVRQKGPGACPKCGMALEPALLQAPATVTKWTCPMHPEIVGDEPGSCPICGMALESMTVTAEEEENAELRDMRRRFWVSTALTVPIVVIAMGHFIPGLPLERLLAWGPLGWVELLLATGGALGRMALFRPRLAVGRQPQPQYVHPDRAGCRSGIRV